MIIETLSWGKLEVNEEQLYHFPKGLPGFDEETEFALIAMAEAPFGIYSQLRTRDYPFCWVIRLLFI